MDDTMFCNIREKIALLAMWFLFTRIKLSRDLSIVQFIFIIAFYFDPGLLLWTIEYALESENVPWIRVTDKYIQLDNCAFCHWFMLGPLYLTLYYKQNLKR